MTISITFIANQLTKKDEKKIQHFHHLQFCT